MDSRRAISRASCERVKQRASGTHAAGGHDHELACAILDNTTSAVIVYDAEGDHFLANAAAYELYGMPPASAPFEDWIAYHDVCRPDGSPVAPAQLPLARALVGEQVPATRLEFRPRLGKARLVESSANPLFDADRRVIGAIAVFRDVDAPDSAAEEAVSLAQEPLRKVFEEVPVGIVMFASNCTIRECNEAFCRITGYTHDELVGRGLADLAHPADVALDDERVRRVFAGEMPSYRSEKRCLRRDGSTIWTSFTASLVRTAGGAAQYGLGIVEDISERKRVEQLMIGKNQRLSQDLESSLAELQLSRARILASADLERRRIERDLHDGAQQRLVALRVRLGLAQDLLEDDPVRAGAMLSELGSDVDAALEEVRLLARGVYPSVLADRGLVEALRAAARNSPLSVTVTAEGIDRHAEDVETAVYFSCVEALQNAAKHAQREASVWITLSQEDCLEFEVRDNGIGFRVNGIPAGAGLANMRDRIEAVGGTLAIESVPGDGTRVSGTVPAPSILNI